jgi:hypothetical protein
MTRDDIIRLAREAGFIRVVAIEEGGAVTTTVAPIEELERFAALVAAAEREECERLKHAMREAMHLLDQPEPRPHAAFSELLLALNPDLPSAIRARGNTGIKWEVEP